MKIAVMSDVHGFSPALHDVLEDAISRGVDKIVVAGDLCMDGPDPAGSIELIQQHGCLAVHGNTDLEIIDDGSSGDKTLKWVRSQLSKADIEFIRALPFSIRIPHPDKPSGEPCADLLIVHANPADVWRHLSPNASDEELLDIIGNEVARTIAFGHLHVAYTRKVQQYELIDVSAVGNPRDKDLRSRYAIFDSGLEGTGWSYEYHFIDYPLERTQALMESSGMPGWKKAWNKLNRAAYSRDI